MVYVGSLVVARCWWATVQEAPSRRSLPRSCITAPLSTALADRYRIERHLGESGMATVYLPANTEGSEAASRYLVVLNWFEELRERLGRE